MSFYRCKEPFSYTELDGVTAVSVHMGDVMDSDDPGFVKRAQFFEPIVSSYAAVEDTTAEPGGLRSLTHRRRGRPPKNAALTDTELEADAQAKLAREATTVSASETTDATDEEKK